MRTWFSPMVGVPGGGIVLDSGLVGSDMLAAAL